MYRKAIVKGSFYPDDKILLSEFISKYSVNKKTNAKAVICPHAGYVYSGAVAVKTLSSVNIPNSVIILGPNHTGLGKDISVYPEGSWETPLGNIVVNKNLLTRIIDNELIQFDAIAHLHEHSIEVILPILKFLNNNISILPFCIKQLSLPICYKTAEIIYKSFKDNDEILFVVSSDMNHFESSKITETKDKKAIDKILELDYEGLFRTVIDNKISMCGIFPTIIMLMLMEKMGINNSKLIDYSHSGMVNDDNSSVVGYAGIIFY